MKMVTSASTAMSVTIYQYKTPSTSADKKLKFTLEHAMKAQMGSTGIALLLFLNPALDEGRWSVPCLGSFTPPGRTRYPWYRSLGGPQGRHGQTRKIFPPPGFNPRTVQLIANRYMTRLWGTKGLSIRPRCIGTIGARTQC